MFTPSGTWIRISWRNARSSASKYINRLCTRISQCSHVSVPSPSGLFRHGTINLFVGSGIGPLIFTPVRSEIDLIWIQTLFTLFVSVPVNEIRAFCVKRLPQLIGTIKNKIEQKSTNIRVVHRFPA
jgi:hypothetical protein